MFSSFSRRKTEIKKNLNWFFFIYLWYGIDGTIIIKYIFSVSQKTESVDSWNLLIFSTKFGYADLVGGWAENIQTFADIKNGAYRDRAWVVRCHPLLDIEE